VINSRPVKKSSGAIKRNTGFIKKLIIKAAKAYKRCFTPPELSYLKIPSMNNPRRKHR
jgi:hypothetical protein